jgi:hypothetical protein
MGSVRSFFLSIVEGEVKPYGIEFTDTKLDNKIEFYKKYKEWCSEENRKPKGRNKFYEDFERCKYQNYKIEEVRENRLRYFQIIDLKNEDEKNGQMFEEEIDGVF